MRARSQFRNFKRRHRELELPHPTAAPAPVTLISFLETLHRPLLTKPWLKTALIMIISSKYVHSPRAVALLRTLSGDGPPSHVCSTSLGRPDWRFCSRENVRLAVRVASSFGLKLTIAPSLACPELNTLEQQQSYVRILRHPCAGRAEL